VESCKRSTFKSKAVVAGSGGTLVTLLYGKYMQQYAQYHYNPNTYCTASSSGKDFNASTIVTLESPVKNVCPYTIVKEGIA
jgi:hypothetical protein